MAKSIKKHAEEIADAMRQLGTYRPDFDLAIKQLATRLRDQELTRKKFREEGSLLLVWRQGRNDSEYQVKNPLLGVMEAQNKDIDSLLEKLGLTPAGLRRINSEMQKKPVSTSVLSSRVIGNG